MGQISACVVRLTALAAITGGADILICQDRFRKGIQTLTGLYALLELTRLAYHIVF